MLQGQNDERTGTLTFFTENPQQDLFTLTFEGLGIWVVDSQPPTADNIHRAEVEMYCEDISFQFTSAAWA